MHMSQCVCVFHARLWNVKSLPSQESLLRCSGNHPMCHLHFKYHIFPPWLPSLYLFLFPFLSISFFLLFFFFFFCFHTHTLAHRLRDFPVYFLMGKNETVVACRTPKSSIQYCFFLLRDTVSQIHCHSFCVGIWTRQNCEILSPLTIFLNICYCVHVCESVIVLVCLHVCVYVWKKNTTRRSWWALLLMLELSGITLWCINLC